MEDQTCTPKRDPNSNETISTRRNFFVQGTMLVSAAVIAGPLIGGCARAADNEPVSKSESDKSAEQSLYNRLGGIFAIAGVVDHFSDEIVKDPVAGAQSSNTALREWHTKQLDRLPGLKFMRTLWVAKVSGGPFEYSPTRPGSTNLGLEEAHDNLKISPTEFDAVAAVLSRSLDRFSVPKREKNEVLEAFAAHKNEVTKGWSDARGAAG